MSAKCLISDGISVLHQNDFHILKSIPNVIAQSLSFNERLFFYKLVALTNNY